MTPALRLVASLSMLAGIPVYAQQMNSVADARTIAEQVAELPERTAKGPLEWPARLTVDGVPLDSGLRMLHERSGVAIAFSSSLLPEQRSVTCHCLSLTVGQALSIMLSGLDLTAAELEGDIVLISRGSLKLDIPLNRVADASDVIAPRPRADRRVGRIVGRVTNHANDQPIPSAQVSIDGTALGALTGDDGRYVIVNVPDGNHVVRARRIGFNATTQTVTVSGGEVTADFALSAVSVALDDIVVTGTAGQSRRREVGNSVGTIRPEQLELSAQGSVSELLQGQVSGMQQFVNEGQVGTGSTIAIRGLSSLTQSSEPLIYIDGVRVNNQTYMANVLTRTSAAGNPGAAGAQNSPKPMDNINPDDVLRVEVIRGPAATTLYGTEAAAGVIQIFTKRGLAGAAPQWNVKLGVGARSQTANSLGPVVGNDPSYIGLKPFLRTGLQHELDVSVSGGTDLLRYFLAAGQETAEGTLPKNDSRRVGIRGNFGFQPAPSLAVDVTSSFSNRRSRFLESGDNTYGFLLNVFRGTQDYTGGEHAMLLDIDNESSTDHFMTGVTLTHSINQAITTRLTLGLDYTNAFNEETFPFNFPLLRQGQRNTSNWTHRTLTADLVSTWSSAFSDNITSAFSVGGQLYQDYDHAQLGTAEGFGGPGQPTLSSGANTFSSETRMTIVNAGFFMQEVLGYKDRYFLTLGARADGNSAFGSNLGLQIYPKVSASYVISDEDFWPARWEVMRLRAAWGEAGKAPGAFDAVRTWTPVAGYDGRPGVTPSNIGNPDLGPERTSEVEFGFETSVLSNRLSADVTYYSKTTSDALFRVTTPPSEGFLIPSMRNVGKINTSGVEFSVTGVPVSRDNVEWSVTGLYSTTKSEVLDLGGAPPFTVGFASLGQWVREGYPIVSAFGRKVTNPNEIADPNFASDEYLGSIYPTFNYGFNTTLRLYNRITLSALLEGAGGHVALNNMPWQTARRDLWPECNDRQPMSEQPAIWRARCSGPLPDRESWIRPADYLKLRTVSVGYVMPPNLVPWARDASLNLQVQNPWKWSRHPGLDPELTRGGTYSVFPARYEYYQLSPARVVTMSVRTSF